MCQYQILTSYRFRSAYENGRKDDLVTFAMERLSNGKTSEVFNNSQWSDSLTTRLGITDFETFEVQDAITAYFNIRFLLYSETCRVVPPVTMQAQVASHFLTILCIPIHRHYMHCIHPPEPILAEAAAQLLEVPKNFGRIVEISNIAFDTILAGGNSRGLRGEYVARLLLTAAHDRAVLQQISASNNSMDGQLKYTQPVKVLEFLKCLLKEDFHSLILQMKTKRKPEGITMDLQTAFTDAYINFTHYMRVENDVNADYHLAWNALARSAALQCYQNQESVDIIIPILLSNPNGDNILDKKSVSAILIQVKNREDKKPVYINADKINFFPSDYLPYIAIVMELGLGDVKEPFVTTVESATSTSLRSVPDTEDAMYRFEIKGVKGVYEAINDTDAVNLENLLLVKDHHDDYPREEVKDKDRTLKPQLYEINKEARKITDGYYGYK